MFKHIILKIKHLYDRISFYTAKSRIDLFIFVILNIENANLQI